MLQGYGRQCRKQPPFFRRREKCRVYAIRRERREEKMGV
jgi:hypothetical protein